MSQLIAVEKNADIPKEFRNTPIGQLFEYHNLNRPFDSFDSAQMLVGMCMDNRKYLHIPDNFAFIIRTGGANLRYAEFKVSYAIAVGNVQHIALIGHTNCGMVGLADRKENFISGLIKNAGWDAEQAEAHFNEYAPMFEIESAGTFTLKEVVRMRIRYPKVTIVPLMYRVEDNRLYLISEK